MSAATTTTRMSLAVLSSVALFLMVLIWMINRMRLLAKAHEELKQQIRTQLVQQDEIEKAVEYHANNIASETVNRHLYDVHRLLSQVELTSQASRRATASRQTEHPQPAPAPQHTAGPAPKKCTSMTEMIPSNVVVLDSFLVVSSSRPISPHSPPRVEFEELTAEESTGSQSPQKIHPRATHSLGPMLDVVLPETVSLKPDPYATEICEQRT